MQQAQLRSTVDTLKALAHPCRLRILAVLREGDLCVGQVAELVGLAPSTVSEHLADLRRVGILAERREGRWVHYALEPAPELDGLMAGLWPLIHEDPTLASDCDRAMHLRSAAPAAHCRKPKAEA